MARNAVMGARSACMFISTAKHVLVVTCIEDFARQICSDLFGGSRLQLESRLQLYFWSGHSAFRGIRVQIPRGGPGVFDNHSFKSTSIFSASG